MRAPVPPDHYLRRTRLLELVDELTRLPVTLVVAPAGSGKTSLLADWVATTPGRTAWLSLEESDRDGVQLWMGVISAIDACVPGSGAEALRVLRRPNGLLDAVYTLMASLDDEGHEPVTRAIRTAMMLPAGPATDSRAGKFPLCPARAGP